MKELGCGQAQAIFEPEIVLESCSFAPCMVLSHFWEGTVTLLPACLLQALR